MQLLLGSLAKQSTCVLQLLLGVPVKAELAYLHIAVALLVAPLKFEGRALEYDMAWKIWYVRVIHFSLNEEYLRAKYLEGGL